MNLIPVLAVDAGGTHSQGGSCNYQNIGIEAVVSTLTDVLSSLADPDEYPLKVKAAVFGMAGLDTEKDRRILEPAVHTALERARIAAERVCLDNDGMMTLFGAVGRANGVLVVCGTGSIACGMTRDGKRARAGGWGHRVGDEGSGYAIGRAALIHILRAHDGRDRPSAIAGAVLEALSRSGPEDLLAWGYSPEYTIDRVAALTSVLTEVAARGDWKARQILRKAGRDLADMALAVIAQLGLEDDAFDLVLSGGVLKEISLVREELVCLIRRRCSAVRIIPPRYEPICGVVLRGLMMLDVDDPGVLDRLSRQLSSRTHTRANL
jgi:N-acetylglucosamine kinase-like BadF-type ATPase